MLLKNLKCLSVSKVLLVAQFCTLLFYLYVNIVNVGEGGSGLPILMSYVFFSVLLFLILFRRKAIYFKKHFFVFLILLVWLSMRLLIDFEDIEILKAYTIATTGGILLFYLVGVFLGISFDHFLRERHHLTVTWFVLLFFCVLLAYLLSNLFPRLREDIFLISGLNGSYQRAGNFLSISFIVISVLALKVVAENQALIQVKKGYSLFASITYGLIAGMALVAAQLFGSNSATAVVGGISIITLISIAFATNQHFMRLHADGRLALPFGKQVARGLMYYSFVVACSLVILLAILFAVTDFDFTKIRLLGFGTGSRSGAIDSLNFRVAILIKSGVDQISYAPLIGNMNVAEITTGSAGGHLHSFLPSVLANLGLVGLVIVLSLFALVFRQLYRITRYHSQASGSLACALVSLNVMLNFVFLFAFANLAVGLSWAVIWFAIGFISQPVTFRSRRFT